MSLWRAEDVLRIVRGRCLQEQTWTARSVVTNPALVEAGALFIATGAHGAQETAQAFGNGAVAAIIERRSAGVPQSAPLLFVEDAKEALLDLSQAARHRTQGKIITLTGGGPMGRLLKILLGSLGKTYDGTKAPTSLLGRANLPPEAAFALFRVEEETPEKTALLSHALSPDLGLIAPDAEGREKGTELFAGFPPNSQAVLPRDISTYADLLAEARTQGLKKTYSYGKSRKSDARFIRSIPLEDGGAEIEAQLLGNIITFRLTSREESLAHAALGALLGVAALGYDPIACAECLEAFRAEKSEGQNQKILLPTEDEIRLWDESGSASETTMIQSLRAFGAEQLQGRRLAVLGDMSGPEDRAAQRHANLYQEIEAAGIDKVFCCGEKMEALFNVLPEEKRGAYRLRSKNLAEELIPRLRDGDTVLIKGAKAVEMYRIAATLKALNCSSWKGKDPTRSQERENSLQHRASVQGHR